ncbi:MAG: VapC toxin family PIN domain ribonuclease [Spirochaetae bacterium HGW-Spirochaetae-7]|jgi:predicted nucleic acid-binding protein|nr:MAG: VapC toxin family PIN domain ribonuclease [Spirochaetae bacterium HGW-Spirochaetae-7]
MGWLIDTCIWVDVERGRISPADVERYTGKAPVYLSPVTMAELAYGVENSPDPGIKTKRQAALNRLRKKPVLHITEETGLILGPLVHSLAKSGRATQHRIQDLWIGAQAIQHGISLLTRNAKDFSDIPGLDIVEYGKV